MVALMYIDPSSSGELIGVALSLVVGLVRILSLPLAEEPLRLQFGIVNSPCLRLGHALGHGSFLQAVAGLQTGVFLVCGLLRHTADRYSRSSLICEKKWYMHIDHNMHM